MPAPRSPRFQILGWKQACETAGFSRYKGGCRAVPPVDAAIDEGNLPCQRYPVEHVSGGEIVRGIEHEVTPFGQIEPVILPNMGAHRLDSGIPD